MYVVFLLSLSMSLRLLWLWQDKSLLIFILFLFFQFLSPQIYIYLKYRQSPLWWLMVHIKLGINCMGVRRQKANQTENHFNDSDQMKLFRFHPFHRPRHRFFETKDTIWIHIYIAWTRRSLLRIQRKEKNKTTEEKKCLVNWDE